MAIACASSRWPRHEPELDRRRGSRACAARARSGLHEVCHGKASPPRRTQPGDRVVYYSPTIAFRGTEKLQAFTALGVVKAGEPYPHDMGGGFCPFRRDVTWLAAREASIGPLLDALDFSSGVRNWGYRLRTGLFSISDHDLRLIAAAMEAPLPARS
jgi:hypothetical protein